MPFEKSVSDDNKSIISIESGKGGEFEESFLINAISNSNKGTERRYSFDQ